MQKVLNKSNDVILSQENQEQLLKKMYDMLQDQNDYLRGQIQINEKFCEIIRVSIIS